MIFYLVMFGFAVFFGLVIGFVGSSVIERGVLSIVVLVLIFSALSAVAENPELQVRFGVSVGAGAYLAGLGATALCFFLAGGISSREKRPKS